MAIRAYDTHGPVDVITSSVSVECQLVLTIPCPACGATHRKRLGANDHQELPGNRYWDFRCHGHRYIAYVPEAHFVLARQRAETIATQHNLDRAWLAPAKQCGNCTQRLAISEASDSSVDTTNPN